MATSPELWIQLQRACQLLKDQNIAFELLSGEEAQKLHPLMSADGIHGCVYTPSDGVVNPSDTCMHFARLARDAGVSVMEGVGAVSLNLSRGRVSSVVASDGQVIPCSTVVVAAGQWTRQLCETAGVHVPTACVPHQYVVFDKMPGADVPLPVIRDYKARIYIKPEVGGFAVGTFEGNPQDVLPESVVHRNITSYVPPSAQFELFDGNIDKANLHDAAVRVPGIENIGVKSWVHGPDTHSVDHYPIMGPASAVPNLFVATGFNSQGIQTAGGVGLATKEWIESGYPSSFKADFAELELKRFHPPLAKNSSWVHARALEGYADLYDTVWPLKEVQSGRNMRISPLHDVLRSKGAFFGSVNGWERPNYFMKNGVDVEVHSYSKDGCQWWDTVAEEHVKCRTEAVLFDMTAFGKLTVKGPRAFEALQFLCSNVISNEPGSLHYTQMLNDNGGIEADLTVCCVDVDRFYLVAPSAATARNLHYIQQFAPGADDLAVSDVSEVFAVLGIMGPASRDILSRITSADLSNEAFPYGSSARIPIAGLEGSVLALRVSYVGELGWELHVRREDALTLYGLLHAAGPEDLTDAGWRAIMSSLRIEKRYLHWGTTSPPENHRWRQGCRGRCVTDCKTLFKCNSLKTQVKTKTHFDFRGRKAIEEQKKAGLRQRLASFTVEDPSLALWGREGIYRNGERVGYITSGGAGHSVNSGNAVGLVSTRLYPSFKTNSAFCQ